METIAELILKLQRPGIDMFEQRQHREEVARRGRAAIREMLPLIPSDPPLLEGVLLETLRGIAEPAQRERAHQDLAGQLAPNNHPSARMVCIRLLAEQYPDATDIGQRFLDFAANAAHETKEMRLLALKALARMKPASAIGNRLVGMLRDTDEDVLLEALGILQAYSGVAPAEEVVIELERLVGPASKLAARCRAIELLGRFGEVDALERVILLPLTDEQEYAAVQTMVRHLLEKPRSVVRLSPKSFEHLVRRLLEKMGYDDVNVQQKGSWDDGVDVTAQYHEERLKGRERLVMIGQCKRYQPSNLVGADVVDKMVESLKAKEAARGVIITTSGFQPAALDRMRKYQQIEWIDGAELQRLLDKHFRKSLYRVLD